MRIIAANLTSGNFQTWDGEGLRILQALSGDVIAIQEFNVGNNGPLALRAFADALGPDGGVFFHRGSGRIPNGVISRYPIVDAGEWDDLRAPDREFTWAVVDVPGPRELFVVSVHLLSSSAGNRNAQAIDLVSLLQVNVPSDLSIVVAGDLNTDGRFESCMSTLSSVVTVGAPWPADGPAPTGNGNTNAPRNRPYDWVLVDAVLRAREVPVELGAAQSFPRGLVFDTRVFVPLPPPAQFGDSAAVNMQHMAVVRDFVLGP